MKKFLTTFLLLATISTFAFGEHLILIATNDCHSAINVNDDNTGGLLRRRAAIDSIRNAEKAKGTPTMLIDAGDQVQGSLYFTLYDGIVEYSSIDSIGYDLIILGNHEFDNKINNTAKYYKNIKAEKLCSNYEFDNTDMRGLFKPYIIKKFGDKRVAFIGINLYPAGKLSASSYKGMEYYDGKKVAVELSSYLKRMNMADYVVMVSHIGYCDADNEFKPQTPSDEGIVKISTDIDIVIGGDSHTFVDPADTNKCRVKSAAGREVLITQTGWIGQRITKIDLDLETGETVYTSLPIDSRYDKFVENNYTAFKEWLSQYSGEVNRLNGNIIGTSARYMINRDKVQHGLTNWVCDVLYDIAPKTYGKKVDLALMNAGGLRKALPAGKISEGRIVEIMPFANYLAVVSVTGEQLLQIIKECATSLRGEKMVMVSRQVQASYDIAKDELKAKLNGKKIDPKKTYTIMTISFLAEGGDFMDTLKTGKVLWQDKEPYRQYFIDYIIDLEKKGKLVNASDAHRVELLNYVPPTNEN